MNKFKKIGSSCQLLLYGPLFSLLEVCSAAICLRNLFGVYLSNKDNRDGKYFVCVHVGLAASYQKLCECTGALGVVSMA